MAVETLEVACPNCGAKKGKPCKDLPPQRKNHLARIIEAEKTNPPKKESVGMWDD